MYLNFIQQICTKLIQLVLQPCYSAVLTLFMRGFYFVIRQKTGNAPAGGCKAFFNISITKLRGQPNGKITGHKKPPPFGKTRALQSLKKRFFA
jgi:hypothetical protein